MQISSKKNLYLKSQIPNSEFIDQTISDCPVCRGNTLICSKTPDRHCGMENDDNLHDKIKKLEAELEEAYVSVEAFENKWQSFCKAPPDAGGAGTCSCSYDSPDHVCVYHSPKLADALAKISEFENLLSNSNAVHLNMLMGIIEKPSWDQIKHLYPVEFQNELNFALDRAKFRE